MGLTAGGAELALRLLEPICELYDTVFSEPQFVWRAEESGLHRERLVELTNDPTFGIVVAELDGALLGFAYGYTLPHTTTRWSRLIGTLPPETSAEWPGRTFVLFDYAVAAAHRGSRIGRALHHRLLAGRTEQRATLTVQPSALATQQIYVHWGWRKIGQLEGGDDSAAPVFDVYLRDSLADLTDR
ncbi:N-acetyltransferase family protein [Dactylosporangium sp. CS-033363]|uniref:GNAT family N-acetyltransferase n=1 Tax=Dactylosporangium sp. CS-033363 TaxID=3239935 RepID=UPI003D93E386